MKAKSSGETINVNGPDGPTSVLIFDRNKKLSFRQKFQKFKVQTKRKFFEKRIKAEPHSIDEVCEFLTSVLKFTELPKTDERYIEEYKATRVSFIMQHKPELMGDFARMPELKDYTEEAYLKHMEEFNLRKKVAEAVPVELFDIDLHMFKKEEGDNESRISIEKTYSMISGGASGTPRYTKSFNKVYKKIYKYYGVTQADIDNKTERYKDLLSTLSVH